MKAASQAELRWEPSDKSILESLLLQIAQGDRQALAELYQRTRGAVYATVLSYLNHADDAQDATQDVYLQIWDNADKYRPKGTPMPWILTVARNLAGMRLRQRAHQGQLDEDGWNAIPARQEAVSPEDRMLLQSALAVLQPEERRIVLLHAAAGLKHREIAQVLRLPLSTVLSKYHRAVRKLNAQMEGEQRQ